MAELYVYNGAHLTLIRDGTVELTESADHGNVGTGRVSLDDATGTYNVIGHKAFYAQQSNCSVPRTFTGYVGRRTYQRNTERVGNARFIDVSLLDLNARLGFRVIRGRSWKRPRETIGERMTALLASDFLSTLVIDDGFVEYPTDELDKNDYRSQFPLDVIRDCALEKGYNYFVYWSSSANAAALWFADSNTSTDFSSTLRISNVSTDIDGSTTFAASQDTQLERDPSEVYSGVQMQFEKGNVFRARAATSSNFEPRHAVGPASRVKRRAKAITLADHYLFERRNEEDVISTSMLAVPDTKVNLVRAGQRISARFSDFDTEGYGEFSWFRILEATKKPLNAEGALYDIGLQLSPQEGGCSTTPSYVQHNQGDSVLQLSEAPHTWRYTLDAASTAGNFIGLMVITDNGAGTPQFSVPPTGWSSAFTNVNMEADSSNRWCSFFYKKSEGETYVDHVTSTNLQAPRYIFIEYAGLTNPVLDSMTAVNRQVGIGAADVPTIPYPAGAALVLSLCYMYIGPESGDALGVSGTGHTLRTPQNSDGSQPDFMGAPSLGIGDAFRAPAGSSGSYTSWRFTFTNDEETMTRGLVFTGDNCT